MSRLPPALLFAAIALPMASFAATSHAAEAATATTSGERTQVRVQRSDCPSAPLADVVGILRVELGAQLASAPSRGPAYDVSVDCTNERVAITVAIPNRPPSSYETNLAGAPANVRARIVALAIAEIVRDLDREPAPRPTPAAPPPPPAPIRQSADRDHVAPPQGHYRPVTLSAFGQASTFPARGVWLGGGGVRFDYVYRRFCAGFDGVALTSNEQFDLGTARILLTYGSPYIAWRESLGALQTRVGLGYALGAARISGHAEGAGSIAGTITGAWTAPYAFAASSVALTDTLRLDLRAQLGWVTLPVVGDVSQISRNDSIDLKGAWGSAQIGLSLAL